MGRLMMFGGLGASFAAVIIVFLQPSFLGLAFGLMLAGGLFSQLGTAIHNRFGRSPRMDQILDDSLKGFGDTYALFHYFLGTHHTLFTPAGVFALIPRDEQGEVRFESDQWIHKPGKRKFGRSRKPLKDLERIAARETKAMKKALTKKFPSRSEIPVGPLLVFIASDTTVNAEGSPTRAAHRKKLKSYLRQLDRQKSFSTEDIHQLAIAFNIAPGVTD